MAKVSNLATRIYLDQYDLSGVLNSSQMEVEQELATVTAFADAGPRRVVGSYDLRHSDLGLFDPADGAYDEQIHALLGDDGDHHLCKLFGSHSEGGVAYETIVRPMSSPRSAERGGAVMLNFDTEGAAGHFRGIVLAHATSTGAEDRSGHNQGVTSSGTVYRAVFRVLSFAGTDLTLKVQDSDDDGSTDAYADVVGLTSGSLTDIGVVSAEVVAATKAWKRVAVSGTFTSALVLVTGGDVVGT